MKIGFVLDDGLDKPDGVQQYILTVGAWLAAQGHEIHYLVGETKRRDIPNLHSLSDNITVRFNKNRASIPYRIKRPKIIKLLNSGFDVLHIQMPYSPILSGFIINNAPNKTAVFGTFHIFPYSSLEKSASKVFSLTLKKSLKRFDNFVSVSEAARQFALHSLGADSKVVPNTVDLNKFKVVKAPQNAKLNIVFLGRLVERKGALELLKAIKHLHIIDPLKNIVIRIGGKGPLEKKLHDFVAKNNLGKFVIFDGYIEEKQKPDYLAQADIAVFPSLGGESFGIVLLEAMASGSGVVLAGDNPGYRSVFNDTRAIIHPKHTGVFTKELQALIKNKELRKDIHKGQQILVTKYGVNSVGPQIVKLYEQALRMRGIVR